MFAQPEPEPEPVAPQSAPGLEPAAAAAQQSPVAAAQQSPVAAVAQQSQGMQWALKQMDKDDDGAISRSEAKGRMLANFDRVDQDSSGLIDKNELSQLFKRLREARGQGGAVGSNSVPDSVELRENVAYREGNEKWKLDLIKKLIGKKQR